MDSLIAGVIAGAMLAGFVLGRLKLSGAALLAAALPVLVRR